MFVLLEGVDERAAGPGGTAVTQAAFTDLPGTDVLLEAVLLTPVVLDDYCEEFRFHEPDDESHGDEPPAAEPGLLEVRRSVVEALVGRLARAGSSFRVESARSAAKPIRSTPKPTRSTALYWVAM